MLNHFWAKAFGTPFNLHYQQATNTIFFVYIIILLTKIHFH